ncbi:MAG: DUF3467 domain-containing protein [Siphonobacter sp.]
MAKQAQQPQGDQIEIELSEEMAEGTYSNLAIISHSQSEFVVDFVRLMPNVPKAKVKARIIITPDHALRLINALQDNIAKYEETFGPISEGGGSIEFQLPPNYRGPVGEA